MGFKGDGKSGQVAAWQTNSKGDGKGWKRSASLPADDPLQKVRKTIGWYNRNGGLAAEINYKSVKGAVEAIDPHQALKIIAALETKAPEIRDPTSWLKKAASKYVADLDPRIKKTIAWYNKHGNLAEPIHYDGVKGALSQVPAGEALKILAGLEEGGAGVKNPTAWISSAAMKKREAWGGAASSSGSSWGSGGSSKGDKGGDQGKSFPTAVSGRVILDEKVTKTITWYNKHGGFREAIDYATVAPILQALGNTEALKLLAGMDGKDIHYPTKWISAAASKIADKMAY